MAWAAIAQFGHRLCLRRLAVRAAVLVRPWGYRSEDCHRLRAATILQISTSKTTISSVTSWRAETRSTERQTSGNRGNVPWSQTATEMSSRSDNQPSNVDVSVATCRLSRSLGGSFGDCIFGHLARLANAVSVTAHAQAHPLKTVNSFELPRHSFSDVRVSSGLPC